MREEIINLIATAEEVVANFEKDTFINNRGFYMNAKTLIDDMIEQIVLIKEAVELEEYVEEIYDANKDDLNFMIDTLNQISELVKTNNIIISIEGKGNYRVKVVGSKEMAIDLAEKTIVETEEKPVDEDIVEPVEIVEEVEATTPEITVDEDVFLDENAIDEFLNGNE